MPVPTCTLEDLAKCEGPVCKGDQITLALANNAITADCTKLTQDVASLNRAWLVAGTLVAAAAALFALAKAVAGIPFVGGVLSAVLLVIAAALLIGALVAIGIALSYQHTVNIDKQQLLQDQAAARDAVAAAMRDCPQCCWPNLQINGCPAG